MKYFSTVITIVIVSIILVLLAFALFGIRILLVKNGEFRGTCAGNSPYLRKEGIACGVCGAKPGEACAQNDEVKLESKAGRRANT